MRDDYQYDVFLIHRSVNKPWVGTLADNPKKNGFEVFFDQWELKPGCSPARGLAEGIDRSRKGILIATPEACESGWVALRSLIIVIGFVFGCFPLSPVQAQPGQLELVALPNQLVTTDGEVTDFTVNVTNRGKGRIYWINVVQRVKDREETITTFHPPETQVILEPGETADLKSGVSFLSKYDRPSSQNGELRLEISTAHGQKIQKSTPVISRVPSLELLEADLRKPNEDYALEITVQNTGALALKSSEFTLRVDGQNLDLPVQRLKTIHSKAIEKLSFALPKKFKYEKDLTVSLDVRGTEFPIHRWRFERQRVSFIPPWQIYLLYAVGFLLLTAAIYYVRIYRLLL